MSTHRTDIDARDQVCLSVCVDGFRDANDARCGLIGTICSRACNTAFRAVSLPQYASGACVMQHFSLQQYAIERA